MSHKHEHIRTTLGKLVNATASLGKLTAIQKPAQLVYHIVKLVKLIQPELKHYEESRQALIEQYGEERPATPEEIEQGMHSPVTVVSEPEQTKLFLADHKALLEVEVELPWKPIKLSALKHADLSAHDILMLEPLLSFDDWEDESSASD